MCVKKVQAYVDSRNILHAREDAALISEIGILTGFKSNEVLTLRKHAMALVRLLESLAACDESAESENVTGLDTVKKDPPADDDNSYSGPSVTRTTELEM